MEHKIKQHFLMKTLGLQLFIIVLFPFYLQAQSVVAAGAAFPLSSKEQGNVEILYSRALNNAKKEAISLVLGERVITERADESRSKEITTQHGKENNENLKQQRSSRKSVASLSKGYVQLIEMIDKGFEGDGHYYVKAKFSVTREPSSELKIGQYWKDAGSPPVTLSIKETSDGQDSHYQLAHSREYFTELFNKNEIDINKNTNDGYEIEILQTFVQDINQEFNTFTTNCRLTFSVIDKLEGKRVKTFYKRNGPVASFSEKEGMLQCLGGISQEFSEKLIRDLIDRINYKSLNGSLFQVSINNLSGDKLLFATELFQRLFQVKYTQIKEFKNSSMQVDFNFVGSRQTLIEAIISSFEMEGVVLVPVELKGNSMQFTIKEKI